MEKHPADEHDGGDDIPQEETLATPGVLDKYQSAGKISNIVLQEVIKKCVASANIVDICLFGDTLIESELKKCYSKKKIEKGIAFPTCVSTNEICGHFSPLKSEPINLKDGDLVKIDLGVHIDGFISMVAHTMVVGEDKAPVEGKKADVILAAYNAIQASLRLLRPGNKNNDVTEAIGKLCTAYGVNPVEGVLSHDLKKHVIDGNNVIINKTTFDQKVDDYEFQVNDVFGLDVIVSTGEGKPKETEFRTTVYKRAIEKAYSLKLKASRALFAEVNDKYPTLAFSLRSFEDEQNAKLGVNECAKHELLHPYPVLTEKSGEFVAHFKYTVLILKGTTLAITGVPLDLAKYKSEKKIEDEAILKLLSQAMDKDSQKKKVKEQAPTPATEEKKA
jgi:curved DNA binding protein